MTIDAAAILREIADVVILILAAFLAFVYRKVTKMEEDIFNRMTKEQVDRRIDEKLALIYQSIEYIKAKIDSVIEVRVKQPD